MLRDNIYNDNRKNYLLLRAPVIFGKIGIQSSRKRQIPWEVVTDDNSISVDHNTVLEKWKNDFETLLNCDRHRMQNDVPVMNGNYPVLVDTSTLNTAISAVEVTKYSQEGQGHGL